MLGPLPFGLKQQIRNYLDYVSDRLTDRLIEQGNLDLQSSMVDEVEFVFAIRFVYQFFDIGYRHYTRMIEFFEQQRIGAFRIGSTSYSRNEPLFVAWHSIVNSMPGLIEDPRLRTLILSPSSVDRVLNEMIEYHQQSRII